MISGRDPDLKGAVMIKVLMKCILTFIIGSSLFGMALLCFTEVISLWF